MIKRSVLVQSLFDVSGAAYLEFAQPEDFFICFSCRYRDIFFKFKSSRKEIKTFFHFGSGGNRTANHDELNKLAQHLS